MMTGLLFKSRKLLLNRRFSTSQKPLLERSIAGKRPPDSEGAAYTRGIAPLVAPVENGSSWPSPCGARTGEGLPEPVTPHLVQSFLLPLKRFLAMHIHAQTIDHKECPEKGLLDPP